MDIKATPTEVEITAIVGELVHDGFMELSTDDICLLEQRTNEGYKHIADLFQVWVLELLLRRLSERLCAITLDIVMPQMDGWQILESLKRDPRTRDLPVVLCSIVEGLEQGLSMGAAACLRKPVTRDELLETLQKVELEPEKAD